MVAFSPAVNSQAPPSPFLSFPSLDPAYLQGKSSLDISLHIALGEWSSKCRASPLPGNLFMLLLSQKPGQGVGGGQTLLVILVHDNT